MRLMIDGVEVPLSTTKVMLPAYDLRRIRGCEVQREGDTLKLAVKVTPSTSTLFGFANQAYPEVSFNDDYHHGELIVDGVVLFSGVVAYHSTECCDGESVYNIELRAGGATWADKAATTKLNESDIVVEHRMNLSSIAESWSGDSPVRYLPIHHDGYADIANTGLYEVYYPLLPQEYHPFISVKTLINSVIEGEGYNLRSNFMSSPLFDKLMFSGAFRSIVSEEAYATMDFKAVRSTSTTATADSLGRVDAWIPQSSRNIGAFVDTVTPSTMDENGNPCSEAFSIGGCFSFDNQRPIFRPRREISVAFDLHFDYTTEYRIKNSKWLQGFTDIYVGNGCYVDVALPNPHIDNRNSVIAGILYKLYIFDYDASASYRITDIGVVSGQISSVQFKKAPSSALKLYIKQAGSSVYTEYQGDWALYNGYVEEYGEQRVEFTLRTPYQVYSPTSPKVFNDIYFEGAEPGQMLTLHAGCSITPVFGGIVGYGDRVTFKDIANHDFSDAEIIDAVVHMFNLCIYTHRPSRSIYIEPYDDFFNGDIVDWRSRQRSDNDLYSECVVDSFMLTELGYQPADGAVGYRDDEKEFGTWRFNVKSYATKQSVQRLINPVFSPTATYANFVGTAPSAELLTVGNRDIVTQDGVLEPRIVLYHGLKTLPEDENWPSPYSQDAYPLASFHSVEFQESLCFEDRDGVEGLHRYYDNELKECATRQLLTTDIYLPPEQYAQLFDPATIGANIRSRFKLNIEGSSSLFRLDAIESYDTKSYIARCRFQRLN
ncbi:MAG: hypothetical protein IKV06_04105 [Alistipes sp.]|nr:hypothetical protein [Alistipes sp.]